MSDDLPTGPASARPPEGRPAPLPAHPYPPIGAARDADASSSTDARTGPTGPLGAKIPRPRRRRPLLNAVLFLVTVVTTSYWGFVQYQLFYLEDTVGVVLNPLAEPRLALAGLPYGLAVIAFLLAHEMGHYLACRYYGIRATLPYFIPIPPVPGVVLLPGTMGAVIRILGPLKSRRALFDVAVAGPLAGFVVALPILAVGLHHSRVVDVASLQTGSIEMGEPLIWAPLQALFGPPVGPEQTLLAHPLAFVGWFALLVTAMNLLPVGQLDGGHLLYALVPRAHRAISLAVVAFMAYAGFAYFSGWILFALLVLVVIGTRHPRPVRFERGLGPARLVLILVATLIFLSSFMLVPVRIDLPL